MTIGQMRYVVSVMTSTPVPDGDGGYADDYAIAEPPEWPCAIEPAAAANQERAVHAGEVASAGYLLTGRYHPAIDERSQLVPNFGPYVGRTFRVISVQRLNPPRNDLAVLCAEVRRAPDAIEAP